MNIQELKDAHDSQNGLYMQSKSDLFALGQVQDADWIAIAETRLTNLFNAIEDINNGDGEGLTEGQVQAIINTSMSHINEIIPPTTNLHPLADKLTQEGF